MNSPNFFPRIWQMIQYAKNIFLASSTPRYVKIILGIGLLYCLSPYDFIPEWIPVIGLMDDLALAALLIAWANTYTIPENKNNDAQSSRDHY